MKIGAKILNWLKAFILPVVVFAIFGILTGGRFTTWTSLLSVFRTAVVPMLLAMAMSFGMMMGMWNFAAGAVCIACAIFSASISQSLGIGVPGMFVLSILLGMVLCGAMGVLYNKIRVPCLVLSLGYAMVVEALPCIFVKNGTGTISLFDCYLGSEPWCYVILLVMFLLFTYVNSFTTFGANMLAIGSNIKIADSAGINIDRVKLTSFVLSGLFLGVAGVVYISTNASVIGVTGFASSVMIFDGIMGVFVGMVLTRYISFNIAILIGALTIRMLSAGLVACGFSSEIRGVLTGLFLFIVISYSTNAGLMDRIKAKKLVIEKAKAEIAGSNG